MKKGKAVKKKPALVVPLRYKTCLVRVSEKAPGMAGDSWVATWALNQFLKITIWLEKKYVSACEKFGKPEWLNETLEHEYREANIAIDMARKELERILGEKLHKPNEDTLNTLVRLANRYGGDAHDKVVRTFHKMSEAQFMKYFDKQLRVLKLL